ncbi:TonB-dependent receptor [Asticcacaulis machinosus]|uniref:TonB-dependent receptor n=1 Tax=Asticcacaulis machinosus TaxID=2984211 RepID=A0ABT5HH57_9CAUL|nr:TonB-dependent receptor [Asticcacaulis machinosus]MDC7675528.1 TonB-dependent receptor [Asticcacaulis machinosus]
MTTIHRQMWRRRASVLALIAGFSLYLTAPAWAQSELQTFDIPKSNLAQALNQYAAQANLQIFYPYAAVAEVEVQGLQGAFSADEALNRLIARTRLEVVERTPTSITLGIASSAVAQASGAADPLTEVIVTGTYVRNAIPAAPVRSVSRTDIEASGYSQIGDIVRALPENFSGGINPGVIAATGGGIGNGNVTNASSFNLRGVGSDATLVLLNGHRLNADSYFQAADISGIPLSAVQRIEVMTDGGSALYGADAVAGVANIITRRNFDGVELQATLGTTTQGGGSEQGYSFLAGRSGARGYGLINIEYARQDEITTADRQFTSQVPGENYLIQPQERSSLFVSLGHQLTDRISVSFDGLYSARDVRNVSKITPTSALYRYDTYTPAYNGALTLDVVLWSDWEARVTAVSSASRNSSWTRTPTSLSRSLYRNDLQYIEASANGTLLSTPAGAVKLAIGAGYRDEGFRRGLSGAANRMSVSRSLSYGFAELIVPLIEPSDRRVGLNALELSVSARTEDYDVFGQATKPKVGLRYVPVPQLTLRGTWGESFKAPSFNQMYSDSLLYVWSAAAIGGTGPGTALMTWGGNPGLKPETSKSWTLGADVMPDFISGSKWSLTYFNIDYEDRVVQPLTNYSAGLSDPIYAPFVVNSPSEVLMADLVAQADQIYNYSGAPFDPANVIAALENRYINATAQTVRGLDLSYRQRFSVNGGDLQAFFNGTFVRLEQKSIPTAPNIILSGTIFNTPDYKVRTGLTWQGRRLNVTGLLNYVSEQLDTGVSPAVKIDHWATLDSTVTYEVPGYGDLDGVRVSLSVTNLFDRDPPKTLSPTYFPIHFDSTNSSIIGRAVRLSLTKRW